MDTNPHQILRWHVAMGADAAVGEEPLGLYRQGGKTKSAPAAAQATPTHSAAEPTAIPAPKPRLDGRELAQAAQNLEQWQKAVVAFDGLAIKSTAIQPVFYDGNPQAKVLLIGEAPGAEEDRSGKPFVGPAGQLLDKMLAAIQLDRTQVFISNILHWRPPNNRQPTPEEMALSLPFVHRLIELTQPKIIVCLGGVALKALFNAPEGIMKLRGTWRDLTTPGGFTAPTLLTYHPAFLLRTATAKKDAWADLQALQARLREMVDG
jgi:uracil-DNA glycosylase family 4